MTREHFDRDLEGLKASVLVLGSEVEHNLGAVADALIQRDAEQAQRLIDFDNHVNSQRIKLMMNGLMLIATQQPMASDMRFIAAVIEIAGELERIHDYVKGIAKTSLQLGPEGELLPNFAEDFPEMAKFAQDMLSEAMMAFSEKDDALARSLVLADDQVDALFIKLYSDILSYVTTSPDQIAHANQLEWTIHNMERAADRVTNISEWIVYMVSGDYSEFDSEFEAPPAPDQTLF